MIPVISGNCVVVAEMKNIRMRALYLICLTCWNLGFSFFIRECRLQKYLCCIVAWIQTLNSYCQQDFLLSENEISWECFEVFLMTIIRGDCDKKIFRGNTLKFLPLIHFEATENQDVKTKVNKFHFKNVLTCDLYLKHMRCCQHSTNIRYKTQL